MINIVVLMKSDIAIEKIRKYGNDYQLTTTYQNRKTVSKCK